MVNEFEILKDVVNKLNAAQINYMLSGSIAMNYYSQPRMTRDIDIVIEIDDTNLFYGLFKNEYYINLNSVKDAVLKHESFNIIHLEELVKIDFIVRKDSEYRKREFERRISINLGGQQLFIVTIEDLILSKLHWAKESKSELQLNDVRKLLTEKVDMDYIFKWAEKLEILDDLKRLSNEK